MIVDFVDPPEMKGPQPTMSADLHKALGAIEKRAQECMDALQARKKWLEAGELAKETVPKLIGHIEKVEEEEVEENTEGANVILMEGDGNGNGRITAKGATPGEKDMGEQIAEDTEDKSKKLEKDTSTKTGKKEEPTKKPRSTPSAARLKEEKRQVRIKEQERRWKEATEKVVLGEPAGDIDLEDAMKSPEEEEKQTEKSKKDTDESGTYGKVYMKTHEKRGERSVSRAERKEQEEKKKSEQAAAKAAQAEADRLAQEEARRIIKRAQLEEKEMAVQKRLEHKRKQ